MEREMTMSYYKNQPEDNIVQIVVAGESVEYDANRDLYTEAGKNKLIKMLKERMSYVNGDIDGRNSNDLARARAEIEIITAELLYTDFLVEKEAKLSKNEYER